MKPVRLWVVSLLDHADDTLQAWVVTSEDQVIPSLKDRYAGSRDGDELPDDLDGFEVALEADGYTFSYGWQEVEL